MITIYTDGACQNNPGPAGIGVVLKFGQHERRVSKFLGHATNNIAELTAIKEGLLCVTKKDLPVKVYSDSKYSINILTNSSWTAKKNVELVNEIKELIKTFPDISFEWVKGHNGDYYNELVDKLAVVAIAQKKNSDVRV